MLAILSLSIVPTQRMIKYNSVARAIFAPMHNRWASLCLEWAALRQSPRPVQTGPVHHQRTKSLHIGSNPECLGPGFLFVYEVGAGYWGN